MREVSVRMLNLVLDLAFTAEVDERPLLEGLPSVALDGVKQEDWIDWDDFVELIDRFERAAGGPDAVEMAVRAAVPTAYPELRAFAAIFVRPIPFFSFVMTQMMRTIYRHIQVERVEPLDGDRVRWTQTIPEPYRPSAAFHRASLSLAKIFPRHLDLPEATAEHVVITPRAAEFVMRFPTPAPLAVRAARAATSTASALAMQVEAVFAKIADDLRAPQAGDRATPAPGSPSPSNNGSSDWATRLALSPRQRDVFALLIEGRPNKDIAAALRCSERNVEFHVGRILRAAHVSSRAALLVKVLSVRE